MPVARDARQATRRRSSCPAARPVVYAPGAPQVDAGIVRRPACRCSASATASRRWRWRSAATVARTGLSRVRPHDRRRRPTAARCSPASRAALTVWMSHGDAVTGAPAGFTVLARTDGRAGRGVRGRRRGGSRACSATPRCCTPSTASRCSSTSCSTIAGCRPTWTMVNIVDEQVAGDPRSGRRQAGDLRPVRRGRLGGGGGAGPAGGRRPAHLRLRRPRAAARG